MNGIASRLLVHLLVLATLLGLSLAPAMAQWSVQAAKGGALLLRDGKWVRVSTGESLSAPFTLRTLRQSELSVARSGTSIALGGGATATISETGKRVFIEQLAGALATLSSGGGGITVTANGSTVDVVDGEVVVVMSAAAVRVTSRSGTVTVGDASGMSSLLPGGTANLAGGNANTSTVSGAGIAGPMATGAVRGNSTGGGNNAGSRSGDAGGTGNGPAGGNAAGGSNGSAGGAGNTGGNSGAAAAGAGGNGGSGNSNNNAGGNSNANAGGNGDSGGSGNGNPNANPNSDGNSNSGGGGNSGGNGNGNGNGGGSGNGSSGGGNSGNAGNGSGNNGNGNAQGET